MRGEHHQARVVAVGQQRGGVQMLTARAFHAGSAGFLVDFTGQAHGGFVAMVSIRDQEPRLAEGRADPLHRRGVAHAPELVAHAVVRREIRQRLAPIQIRLQPMLGIRVQHELGRERGAGGAGQLQTIELGPGEGALVRHHHAVGEGYGAHQREEAATREPGAAAGRIEGLRVAPERRRAFSAQHPLAAPGVEQAPSILIARVAFALRQIEVHHVVWMASGNFSSHRRVDHVVGRSQHPRVERGVVTEGIEGSDVGHLPRR